jgi:hypothetical protein
VYHDLVSVVKNTAESFLCQKQKYCKKLPHRQKRKYCKNKRRQKEIQQKQKKAEGNTAKTKEGRRKYCKNKRRQKEILQKQKKSEYAKQYRLIKK